MTDFLNQQVKISEIPNTEALVFEKVDKAYAKSIVLHYGFIGLGIVIIGCLPLIISALDVENEADSFFVWLALIGSVLLAISFILFAFFRSKKVFYVVRNHDIIVRKGLVLQSEEIVPYSRVQHIAMEEYFFYRVFGLCQLEIFTAATAGALIIPGLTKADGEKIKGFIANRIKGENDVSLPLGEELV